MCTDIFVCVESSRKMSKRLISGGAVRWARAAGTANVGKLSRLADVISRNMATERRCVSIDDINPHLKVMEYAVRGPLVIRAGEIEKELTKVRSTVITPFAR